MSPTKDIQKQSKSNTNPKPRPKRVKVLLSIQQPVLVLIDNHAEKMEINRSSLIEQVMQAWFKVKAKRAAKR